MIIGVTGKNGSGKDEVLKYLESKGFNTFSLSDLIRERLREMGLEETRENMISIGNELRENNGSGVLGKLALERTQNQEKVGIGSIRNPAEIEELRKNNDFFVIGVDAKNEIRYSRILERNRGGDIMTFEEFNRIEEIENSDNPAKQQLNECLRLSDSLLENNGTLEAFHQKIEETLLRFKF